MDLDKLILQKQNEAMHENTLDIDWMNWDVSMEVILGEIERLADHLDDTLTRRRTVTRNFGLRKRKYASWIQKFRGIDVRLSRNHIYRVYIREWMKRQYKQLQKRHAVPIESGCWITAAMKNLSSNVITVFFNGLRMIQDCLITYGIFRKGRSVNWG